MSTWAGEILIKLLRWVFKGFAVLAMLGVLGVGVLLGALWLERRTETTLPTPVSRLEISSPLYPEIEVLE